MIRDNQQILNRINVLIDAVIIAASLVLAYFIKFYIITPGPGYYLELSYYYDLLPFVIPGYILIYSFAISTLPGGPGGSSPRS